MKQLNDLTIPLSEASWPSKYALLMVCGLSTPSLVECLLQVLKLNQPLTSFSPKKGQTSRLYVPVAYNFMAVDGAILLLDHASKKATIFAIQITLSQTHKQSDEEFHKSLWSTWVKPIVSAGFSIESTFVWIDTKQPSEHVKPKAVKALRSGNKVVHPEYSVIHVGVETVDRRLAIALNIL